MNGREVRRRLEGRPVAAPDLPPSRHPRVRWFLRVAPGLALVAVLALLALVDGGIFGTPWYRFVTVDGGSMAPTIGRGDLILVVPAPATVEPGMILVLRVGGQLVTHRVVAVNPDGTFVTRGDANSVDDAWGGQQVTVEGQYLATLPVLGNVLRVGSRSEASFTDAVNAGMTITVGPFPPPVACPLADFGYDASGAQPYALLTVHVWAKGTLPANCALSFSLNSYRSQGPDWPHTGTQALYDHQAVTLDASHPTGTLTVRKPPCYGQTDFYTGTMRFDGVDSALPHYPDVVVPQPLLAWSNGGKACKGTLGASDPSAPIDAPSPDPSTSPDPSASVNPPVLASQPPAPSPDPPVVVAPPSPDPSASPDPSPSPSPVDTASPAPTDVPAPTTAAPTDAPSPTPAGG